MVPLTGCGLPDLRLFSGLENTGMGRRALGREPGTLGGCPGAVIGVDILHMPISFLGVENATRSCTAVAATSKRVTNQL
jgi:hypothetical protein